MNDNSPDSSADASQFTDEDARNILRRAVELEQQGSISADKLREIAREAQIDPAALNLAMAEALAEKRISATGHDDAAQQVPLAQMAPMAPLATSSQLSWQGWVLVAALVFIAILAVIRL